MYSANQVRQLYVVDDNHPLAVKVHNSVDHNGGKLISMEYTDDLGNVQLVDLIEKNDIRNISVKAAPELKAREAVVTLNAVPRDPNNANNASSDWEAYLTIIAPGFYGDTLENKEIFPVNITSADAGANTADAAATAFASKINNDKTLKKYFTASAANAVLTITEKFNVNDFRIGLFNLHSAPFVISHGHYVNNMEDNHLIDAYTPNLIASVTYGQSLTEKVNGSFELAQLEWFCHGFRGDVYREKAFPNNFPYNGLIVPSANAAYYTCDVHYFWHGYGNQVDKSEKVLTFVGSSPDMTAIKTAIDNATSNNRIPAAQQAGGNG